MAREDKMCGLLVLRHYLWASKTKPRSIFYKLYYIAGRAETFEIIWDVGAIRVLRHSA